jgi:hypothetical protein
LFAWLTLPFLGCWHSIRSARPKTVKVKDLHRLEAQYQRKPQDAKIAVDTLLAYAELIENAGSTLELVAAFDKLAEHSRSPDMTRRRAQMNEATDRYLQGVGVASTEQFARLLERGVQLARQIPGHAKLTTAQHAAAHVAGAQIFLRADQPNEAIMELAQAEKLKADRVAVGFVRSDILTYQKRYSEAIQQLRQTSVDLSAWADRPPTLEQRLLWGLAGTRVGRVSSPFRSELHERHWRNRKQALAQHLQEAIRLEVMALQGQEKAQHILGRQMRQ